jgi:hypothetical protein
MRRLEPDIRILLLKLCQDIMFANEQTSRSLFVSEHNCLSLLR